MDLLVGIVCALVFGIGCVVGAIVGAKAKRIRLGIVWGMVGSVVLRDQDDEGEWIEETPDPQQRIEFVLAEIGLDIIESKEERVVLVAQYDGRRLKPWREIQAPVHGRKVQAGIMNGSSSTGCSARDHIRYFNLQHDYRLTAKRPVLINETGLPDETPLSEITVSWHGREALKIAQRWFEEEFGITFVEERRVMPVFTVKRRE